MNRADDIIRTLSERVGQLYGNRLRRIVLYGSCARKEATEASDIDIAVVLTGDVQPGREIDRMIDLVTEVNLRYGALVSVYPVSEQDYANTNSPLLINLRREGVQV